MIGFRRLSPVAVPGAALVLGMGAIALLPAPAGAQIPRRTPRFAAAPNAPRIMVATPYAFSAADSLPAVEIGRGLRRELSGIGGRDFVVIPDSVMNSALVQYGYNADAILTAPLAVTLAKNIQARYILQSSLARIEGGRFRIQARLVGVNDDAGVLQENVQVAGQKNIQFGEKTAQLFSKVLDAMDEARDCVNLKTTKPKDADEKAQKAIKLVSNHGLAHLCQAQMAIDAKKPRAEILPHLEKAVEGDSLSLVAWGLLAGQYEAANDTAKTLAAYAQLLRVAPTNQKLREDIFKRFLNYGATDRARQVADEGLALDPYNADLYDLKSNACLFGSDYKCAIDALEQLYAIDSTKADTLFFIKITAAAGEKPDTNKLIQWSATGVARFPENIGLLESLNRGLVFKGLTDSSLVVTKKLMSLEPGQSKPALAAIQMLVTTKKLDKIGPFAEYIEKNGDAEAKGILAQLYVAIANGFLQPPQDYASAALYSEKSLAMSGPQGKYAPQANFIWGVALFQTAAKLDEQTAAQKSCDLANQEAKAFADAKQHITDGKSVNAGTADQLLGAIGQYETRTAQMMKVFCKTK